MKEQGQAPCPKTLLRGQETWPDRAHSLTQARMGLGWLPQASVSSQRGSQLPQISRKLPSGLTQHNKIPQVPIMPLLQKSVNEWQFWSLPRASGSEGLRQQKAVPTQHLCPNTGPELGAQMVAVSPAHGTPSSSGSPGFSQGGIRRGLDTNHINWIDRESCSPTKL